MTNNYWKGELLETPEQFTQALEQIKAQERKTQEEIKQKIELQRLHDEISFLKEKNAVTLRYANIIERLIDLCEAARRTY